MEGIKDTIKSVINHIDEKRGKGEGALEIGKIIKKILTRRQLRHIKFSSLYQGVVTLDVDSSAWAYEMNMHRQEIVGKLNSAIKELKQQEVIKDIRFRLGDIDG